MSKYLKIDAGGTARCWWCDSVPIYVDYHDQEWGQPVTDDSRLFEKLCLEGFQAGLSWLTILKKRESFREAFDQFDFEKVARFSQRNVRRLLQNDEIVRHRGKIEATINNAQRAVEMVERMGSLASFLWRFRPRLERKFNAKRSVTTESQQMSKELKRLGWKFVGPTTCYSFMQAMGIVNDHHPRCHKWSGIDQARRHVSRPE